MGKRLLSLIFILLFLSCCGGGGGGGGGGLPSPEETRLAGRVSSPAGELIFAALVILGEATFTTLTDAQGNYSFSGIPEGDYNLRIIKEGFFFQKEELTVSRGENSLEHQLAPDSSGICPQFSELQVSSDSEVRNYPFEVSLKITDPSGSGLQEAKLVQRETNRVFPLLGPVEGGNYQVEAAAPLNTGSYSYEIFAVDNQNHISREQNQVKFTVLPSGTVSGRVTLCPGGEAVAGANLQAEGTHYSATTGNDGEYTLNLPAGFNSIRAEKAGHSTACFQQLYLREGETQTANLICYPVFNPEWEVSPLDISVAGLSEADRVSGELPLEILALAQNPIRKIQLRVGNYYGEPLAETSDSDRLEFNWQVNETSRSGETFVYLEAVDRNYNWTARRIRVSAVNSGIIPPQAVSDLVAYAYTFGEDLEAFRAKQSSALLSRPGGKNVDLKSAPPNATILLLLSWEEAAGATGYRIFRKLNQGAFTWIADLSPANITSYSDYDPLLTPGDTVSYSIQAYSAGGLSQLSFSPPVTILEPFKVYLQSPRHNQSGVSLRPTFTWSLSSAPGEIQEHQLYLWRKNGGTVADSSFTGVTEAECPVLLLPLKVYEWDLYSQALGSYDSSRREYLAVSYPKEAGDTVPGNSSNGSFLFTSSP